MSVEYGIDVFTRRNIMQYEMELSLEEITHLFVHKGTAMYGQEAISQLEHALQCAALAELAGKNKEIITACLLHDLGHLFPEVDERHEERVIPLLRNLFDATVTEPIRLHVEAKRYLCSMNKNYWATLSPASKRSLELQGGIFTVDQAKAFIAQPYAKEAVQLRIWDDQAKVLGKVTPSLAHFSRIMKACATC